MQTIRPSVKKSYTNTLANLFFKFFAFNFNTRPSLNKYLKCDDGWLNFTFGIGTESGSVEQAMRFENGKVIVLKNIPDKFDSQLIFVDENAVKEAATQPPNKLMLALMENRMITIGNLGYLQLINFYLSLLLKHIQIAKLKKETKKKTGNTTWEKPPETVLNPESQGSLKLTLSIRVLSFYPILIWLNIP